MLSLLQTKDLLVKCNKIDILRLMFSFWIEIISELQLHNISIEQNKLNEVSKSLLTYLLSLMYTELRQLFTRLKLVS